MLWEKLIEKDKITSVRDDFYQELLTKLKQRILFWESERFFRKKHVWMSIAAGLLLGLIMLNLQNQISITEQRTSKMEAWIGRYYLDDLLIEKLDTHLF